MNENRLLRIMIMIMVACFATVAYSTMTKLYRQMTTQFVAVSTFTSGIR